MAIQEENIVFVQTQVMDDVPEGGGEATGVVIADGAVDNIFKDVTDLDRAYGNVSIRIIALAVQSIDDDALMGAKTVITAMPSDPSISYTLFSTGNLFDTRSQALGYMENYQFKGPMWNGALYENHIKDMGFISIIQEPGSSPPPIGKTLYIVKNEGSDGEASQYVKVIGVSSELRTFSDDKGTFQKLIVKADLSSELQFDFSGFPVSRDGNYSYTGGKTRIRDTVVADATHFFGTRMLTAPATIADKGIYVDSIFTQLVPSADVETPLVNRPMANEIYTTIQGVRISQAAHSRSITVTAENRRTNWVERVLPIPAPDAISIEYMAQGVWYTLAGDGSGAITGSSPSFGAGTLDSTTGDVAVTLGALPDVGSQIIITSASAVHYANRTAAGASKVSVRHSLGEPVVPASLALTWLENEVEKTATAAADGTISGHGADGYIVCANGDFWVEFTIPPDANSRLGIVYETADAVEQVFTGVSLSGGFASLTLTTAPVKPGTIHLEWELQNRKTDVYTYPA